MTDYPFDLDYIEKVRSIAPHNLIGLWPQFEKQGNVSHELSARAADGTFVGVTLGQPGIGDWYGYSVPRYDGANDYDDIWSLVFQGIFDGSEGSLFLPARVFNLGVWSDAVTRVLIRLRVDAANIIQIAKLAAPINTLRFNYTAGGVALTRDIITTSINWLGLLLTWSATLDEVRVYIDGDQQGLVINGLGIWAGLLGVNTTVLGAAITTPTNVWNGYLGPCAIKNAALAPSDARQLWVIK